jgi:hypothetical protein
MIILPVIAFSLLFVFLKTEYNLDWRRAFNRSIILVGVYGVLGLELLSLFSSVNPTFLLLLWSVPGLGFAWLLIQNPRKLRVIHLQLPPMNNWEIKGMLLGLGTILILTAITAYLAPPNTYDSLTYHMSRVAHWAQEGGVRPYASGIMRQNYMSPGAEMMVLQTYVLSQGDRWANVVQWFAMVVSVIGVSTIARDLGASRTGQLFTSLFAASLPMGIAQASSTMTDYVTAMWVLIAASEVLAFDQGAKLSQTLPFAAAAAGLSILAKPTGAMYIVPFALWAGIQLFRKYPLRTASAYSVVAIAIVVFLNLGYLLRNWLVFGNLLGGGAQLNLFSNEIFDTRVLISNLLRNASLQAGTPWQWWNDNLYSLLAKIHWKLDLGLTDPRTSIHPFFTIWPYPADEARATNTIQAVMILVVIVLVMVSKKYRDRSVMWFGLSGLAGFTLFASFFKFDVLGSRYHMPLFVLLAPVAGVVLSKISRAAVPMIASFLMFIGAVPLLFSLESRTLVPTEQGDSVFTTRRLDQYFMQAPGHDEPYIEMTSLIEEVQCSEIGLMLRGDSPEYPLWVLLGAPDKAMRMEWIIRETDVSGKFRDPYFKPCALICETCVHEGDRYNDLSLVYDNYGFRLYLHP